MLTTLTTVGYGDYLPKNVYEEIFILGLLLIGVAWFSYAVGMFHTVFADYSAMTAKKGDLAELNVWIKSLEELHGVLPAKLKKKILAHFMYYSANDMNTVLAKGYWRYKDASELRKIDQEYLSLLPAKQVRRIFRYLYDDFFYKFSYFFGKTWLRYDLAPHLQPRQYQTGKTILKQGDMAYELIFVLSGHVDCGIIIDREFHSAFVYLQGRTIIGDMPIFSNSYSIATFKAVNNVETFVIPRQPLIAILDAFYPEERVKFFQIISTRHNQIKKVVDTLKDENGYVDEVIPKIERETSKFTPHIDSRKQFIARMSTDFDNRVTSIPEKSYEAYTATNRALKEAWEEVERQKKIRLEVVQEIRSFEDTIHRSNRSSKY